MVMAVTAVVTEEVAAAMVEAEAEAVTECLTSELVYTSKPGVCSFQILELLIMS